MRNQGVKRAIMVVQQNMTPFAKQCLNEMQPKYHIELVSRQNQILETSIVYVSHVTR